MTLKSSMLISVKKANVRRKRYRRKSENARKNLRPIVVFQLILVDLMISDVGLDSFRNLT